MNIITFQDSEYVEWTAISLRSGSHQVKLLPEQDQEKAWEISFLSHVMVAKAVVLLDLGDISFKLVRS